MLRVTVLELPSRWGNPLGALWDVGEALAKGPDTDLVLLPEASLTGYCSPSGDFDLTRYAEPLDGPTARALAELAKEHETTVVGPLVLEEGSRLHNAMVGFGPDGTRLFAYRKRHPWLPETWATPGRQPLPVFPVGMPPDVVRVTACICYDVHFVASESAAALDDASILLFPSAWVEDAETIESATDTRGPMLSSIAKDHGIVVVNANWGVGDIVMPGQGTSRVIDARGEELARTPAPVPRGSRDALDGAVDRGIHRIDVTLELPAPRRLSSAAR